MSNKKLEELSEAPDLSELGDEQYAEVLHGVEKINKDATEETGH